MLGNGIVPEHADAAGVGQQQTAGQSDGRRLASAVRANQAEHLASSDGQRHVVEGTHLAIASDDLLEDDGVGGHRGISASTGMPTLSTPWRLSAVTLIRY